MAAPYPGFPPSFNCVRAYGGYVRTCLVVELCTTAPLEQARLTQIEDSIAMTLRKHVDLEKFSVVGPNRFDRPLREALRL
jgi:hypothetical protein